MTFTHIGQQTFHVVHCYTCGVPFGIEVMLYKRAVTDALGSLFCPACGAQSCWRESDDQKKINELTRKLQWETSEVARQKQRREAAEASLAATKGVMTRIKKRHAAGVCPCCHRTFRQLTQHMTTKHPVYRPEP